MRWNHWLAAIVLVATPIAGGPVEAGLFDRLEKTREARANAADVELAFSQESERSQTTRKFVTPAKYVNTAATGIDLDGTDLTGTITQYFGQATSTPPTLGELSTPHETLSPPPSLGSPALGAPSSTPLSSTPPGSLPPGATPPTLTPPGSVPRRANPPVQVPPTYEPSPPAPSYDATPGGGGPAMVPMPVPTGPPAGAPVAPGTIPLGPGISPGGGFPAVMGQPLFSRVEIEDLDHIHPCAKPTIVRVRAPKGLECDACAGPFVFIEIMAPEWRPEIKVRRRGRKVIFDYGDYNIDVTTKRDHIEIDYDD